MPLSARKPATRATVLARSGVTASATALILAGFAGSAAAQEHAEDYEVARGDSLSAIATAHGLDDAGGWRLLFDANPEIADPDLITPGQVLRIPAPDEDVEPRELPGPPAPPATGTDTTPPPEQGTPEPAPAPAPQPEVATSAPAGVWDQLAQCESGGNWQANTGNGYYGGLQFLPATWHSVGGTGLPHEASREEQIQRGQVLQARSGWGQWPACSRQLGLR